MGIGQSIEGESRDRTDIALPQVQRDLIAAIRAAQPETPTVMFLLNGGMLDIAPEKKTVPAILECFYPGFWGGQAIADTLFGDNHHLGGRMPFTVYPGEYTNQVKMTDMSMTPSASTGSPGRSYRYYTGEPTWPFGFGLSLTNFSLTDASEAEATAAMSCSDWSGAGENFRVEVTNTGKVPGDTVVLAFFHPKAVGDAASLSPVLKQLFGFERVHLMPGESTLVTIKVTPETMQMTRKATGDVVVSPGLYQLEFSDGVSLGFKREVRLTGETALVARFPQYGGVYWGGD